MVADDRGFVSLAPATSWENRLISGGGSLGALVAGDPTDETITLSHERLFLPLNRPLPPVHTAELLAKIRDQLLAGQYQAASEAVVTQATQEGYGSSLRWIDPLVPGFDLRLHMRSVGLIKGYSRGTDFGTGVVTVHWADDRGAFTRRLFVSRPDDVLALSISGPGRGQIDVVIQLDTTPPGTSGPQYNQVFSEGVKNVEYGISRDMLSYRSRFSRKWPGSLYGYAGVAWIVATGGSTSSDGRGVVVRGADEVVVLAALDVSDTAPLPLAALRRRLRRLDLSFERLLARHAAVHGDLFNRARLDLGGENERLLPAEELLAMSRQDGPLPALLEKEFDACRYAVISSSGKLPPTLQGVWSATWAPAWSGGYVHNGNCPTALAALLSTNTPELLQPYFTYLESFVDDMRENARRLYGCRGIYLPAHTSTHGLQNHFNATWCHTFWTAGAGWAARFLYDYWQYTGDDGFLASRALPFMEQVAEFYEDFLVEGPDGKYVFVPSYSPENHPANSSSQACVNATMDIAVAKDLLRNLITASETLRVNADMVPQWAEMLGRMPDYPVNKDGALAEWAWPSLQDNHAHRHASHLYPVLYEVDPEIAGRPDLLEACRRAVHARMAWRREQDGGDMAFGLVQLGLAAAHLRMVDEAYAIVGMLASRYFNSSLVPTHDAGTIFNVDIGGGLPELIVAMLVQSSRGALELLPALPTQWTTGSIEGVACRGQVIVDSLTWNATHIRAVLRSAKTQPVNVTFPAGTSTIACASSGQVLGNDGASRVSLVLLKETAVIVEARRGPWRGHKEHLA